jgi:3-hydroxyacyl-CoA dehydrogenase
MAEIKKVAVVGAGVMGAAIAAQVANAGVPVLLLDIVPPGAKTRNALADGAVAKMLKTEPAPFMGAAAAKLVKTGNIEDDLAALGDCDWIVEAVLERLDVKQALYAKIEAVRKPGSMVSSNTSTIPLARLLEGMPASFAAAFMITHFFNPPRYMRLLEIVTGPATDSDGAAAVCDFADRKLGKTLITCNDSPGFIGNRLGVYWLQAGVIEALDRGVAIEVADALIGRPMGIPKTGVFGLIDLVGLDLMPHINASLRANLPATDPFHAIDRKVPSIEKMIAEGYIGRKGKGGFYRINRDGGGKKQETIDLASGAYRPTVKAVVPEIDAAGKDLKALLSGKTPAAQYAWAVLSKTLAYAARLVPEATDTIAAVDEAMRYGYGWKWGPFELIDMIGAEWLIAGLKRDGLEVPALLESLGGKTFYRVENGVRQYLSTDGAYHDIVRPAGVLLLEDVKRRSKPVLGNGSAKLWDIGDGVVCLEFTSKSNSFDDQILKLLGETIALVQAKYKALVIYNEGKNFSVGANLGLALFAANIGAWGEIAKSISGGQETFKALKYAPFPTVAAPSGMALGGGCEIVLHASAVQAHAETYIGLVEPGVGLVPGWGGCKEMLTRWSTAGVLPKGPMPAPSKVFEIVSMATVAKSAAEARDLLFLRPSDGITMNRDRLLADAKARALALVDGYAPPKPVELKPAGAGGKTALKLAVDSFRKLGIATEHDAVVAEALADILTGGELDLVDILTEDQLLALEQKHFLRLARTPATLARIEHMLATGKPLRN